MNANLQLNMTFNFNCYPEGCATTDFVPCQCNTRVPLGKPKGDTLPRKIVVTSKSPVGDISVVTLIRTDTTLEHRQKAEKVWHNGLCIPYATLAQKCAVCCTDVHPGRAARTNCGNHIAAASQMSTPFGQLGLTGPQKLWKSHCCVPFTAIFSKRRKIGAI